MRTKKKSQTMVDTNITIKVTKQDLIRELVREIDDKIIKPEIPKKEANN